MSMDPVARAPRAFLSLRAAVAVATLIGASLLPTAPALAAGPICGVSGTHTVCVTTPADVLTGPQTITVTDSPNNGVVIATWQPTAGTAVRLVTKAQPSASFGGTSYSFVWPTQKYLDAPGVLAVQADSPGTTPVTVDVTLSNGNLTDIQHTPNDWQSFLPVAWTGASDPIVAAVGDGPADETKANKVSDSIVTANPAVFLFLGDIYEQGTYTENLNHYGQLALDGDPGMLWGRLAPITQPTVGNHEFPNLTAWTDFWHQRPDVTSFTFGGVLFLDLDSSKSMTSSSSQYAFVQQQLAGAPACVVAYWHIPATGGGSVSSKELPMWKLLASNGGDLVLSGHRHNMTEMVPLDASGLPGGSAHMVQLIAGSGGHKLGAALTGTNVAWSLGKTGGAVYLTLNGAASGGSASSLSWAYQDVSGTVHRTDSLTC